MNWGWSWIFFGWALFDVRNRNENATCSLQVLQWLDGSPLTMISVDIFHVFSSCQVEYLQYIYCIYIYTLRFKKSFSHCTSTFSHQHAPLLRPLQKIASLGMAQKNIILDLLARCLGKVPKIFSQMMVSRRWWFTIREITNKTNPRK